MKRIGMYLGAAGVLALAFFVYQKLGALFDAKIAAWKAEAKVAAETTAVRVVRSAKADTVYVTVRTGYKTARTQALTSPTVTPRDSAIFAQCDAVVSACDERHAADSSEKAGLREELRIARAKPTERQKRFTLFGEGLYDLLAPAPVFRAGAELRLLGEIRATAVGDLAIPPAGQARVQTRALVGIRYVF